MLIWLDFETTGLSPEHDFVLEVGVRLTDDRLLLLEQYDTLVVPIADWWLDVMDPGARDMHESSGLLADLRAHPDSPRLHDVDAYIVDMVTRWRHDDEPVVLAGSGVGPFDLQIIREQMVHLPALLTYYVVDVGVLRRFGSLCGVVPPDDLRDRWSLVPHRAPQDVERHLEEARWWQAMLRTALVSGVWDGMTGDPTKWPVPAADLPDVPGTGGPAVPRHLHPGSGAP